MPLPSFIPATLWAESRLARRKAHTYPVKGCTGDALEFDCEDIDQGRNIYARGSVVLPSGSCYGYRGGILAEGNDIDRHMIDEGEGTCGDVLQANK